MIVDLFEFTRQDESASGEIPVARLSRVESASRQGALAWSAQGSMRGRHGTPRLDLAVDGVIELVCSVA